VSGGHTTLVRAVDRARTFNTAISMTKLVSWQARAAGLATS
jgi:hypothetical protein